MQLREQSCHCRETVDAARPRRAAASVQRVSARDSRSARLSAWRARPTNRSFARFAAFFGLARCGLARGHRRRADRHPHFDRRLALGLPRRVRAADARPAGGRGVRAEGLDSRSFPRRPSPITTPSSPGCIRRGTASSRTTWSIRRCLAASRSSDRGRAAGHALVGRRADLGHRRAAGPDRGDDVLAGIGRRDCRRSADVLSVVRHDLANEARVDQLLEWMRVPEPNRPTFLTLYFSDVDTAGHDYGPETEESRHAALDVDARHQPAGRAGSNAAGLANRTNYVLVSDHGMSALSRDRIIVLDDYSTSRPSISWTRRPSSASTRARAPSRRSTAR